MIYPLSAVARLFLWLLLALGWPGLALAQDNCGQAEGLSLTNGKYCSAIAEFDNENGDQAEITPSCFSGNHADTWFVFTPLATDVVITIIGASGSGSGGTLNNPEVALYEGVCTALNQIQCESDVSGSNIVELYKGGLQIGVPHYIQVQGRNRAEGSFQVCIDNFNAPALPGSDCFSASRLCNKDAFSVDNVVGGGLDPDEARNSSCLSGFGVNSETNSTWFQWTAETSGSLTFTLTPSNPADDLDFVLYEIQGDTQTCQGLVELRCMAAGDFVFPSPCMGPTGLRTGEPDASEEAGCPQGQNNFLAPIEMEAGKNYALLINNFTSTSNGFSIEFGGTGTFRGPEADFVVDDSDLVFCVGQQVTFSDASLSANDQVQSWQWQFGGNNSMRAANTRGPHTLQFNQAGTFPVVLQVTNEQGCIISTTKTIRVECCPDHFSFSADVRQNLCAQDSTGSIQANAASGFGPLSYEWSNGNLGPELLGVPEGQYQVQIFDAAGCDTTLSFTLAAPPPLDVDTLIQRPTCDGGMDGAIQLNVAGGTAPYEFRFQNAAFDSLNRWDGLPVGDYSISVLDSNGCQVQPVIPLRELELVLEPIVDPVRPPSCAGFSDGAVEARIANGQAPYLFDWQDGQGFRPDPFIENLSEGNYSLEVTDANLCRGNFTFSVQAPAPLGVTFDTVPISCYNEPDGNITARAEGGTGAYRYTWNGSPGDSSLNNIPAGTYNLTLLDANGCQLDTQFALNQPPPLTAGISEISDISCFGESTGRLMGMGDGGTAPYLFSLDGGGFQSNPEFTDLPAGTYLLTVEDAAGCQGSTEVQLGQASPFEIEAGNDWQIRLGGSVQLSAFSNEPIQGLEWFPADSLTCVNCERPLASPSKTTTYQVRAVNGRNCFAQDSVTVFVLDFKPLYFPTAFSPNSDGSNDFFTLFGSEATQEILNLSVFDRWGNLVFDRKNLEPGLESQGWDGTWKGKNMPAGTYIFLAEILFIDGNTDRFEGEVILLR